MPNLTVLRGLGIIFCRLDIVYSGQSRVDLPLGKHLPIKMDLKVKGL